MNEPDYTKRIYYIIVGVIAVIVLVGLVLAIYLPIKQRNDEIRHDSGCIAAGIFGEDC